MMKIIIIVFERSCALSTWVFKLTIRLNNHHNYKKVQFYHCMSHRLQSFPSGDIRRSPKKLQTYTKNYQEPSGVKCMLKFNLNHTNSI